MQQVQPISRQTLLPFTPRAVFLLAVVYTALIGFGMYWCYHIEGISYGKPEMVQTLWWVEIVLTILTLGALFTIAGWGKVGFGVLRKSALLWLAIPFAIMVWSWIEILPAFANLSDEKWNLFLLIGFTTALVGFSEEVVFRGFVLRGFLTRYPLWASMLVSAVLFSLLHSVNFFAGLTGPQVVTQLLFTFSFGLFYAPLAYKLNNLWPLIIMHWLWDFLIIGAASLGAHPTYAQYCTLFNALAIIPLWGWTLWQERRSRSL